MSTPSTNANSNTSPSVSVVYNFNGTVVQAVDELQNVTISGSPTGGTVTATIDASIIGLGIVTATWAYNANAAAVLAALVAVLGSGNAFVQLAGAGNWNITFLGEMAGTDIPAMTFTHTLTGGTSPAVGVTETNKGVRGTLGWVAPRGALMVETGGAVLYINTGTQKSVVWQYVGEQAL